MFPFFNRARQDTATVRQKLAIVEQEISTAEAELDRMALHAVLADDHSASEAAARLDKLRQRRELLSRAVIASEQAERDAEAAIQLRDFQARRRAAAQHASRLEKAAKAVSEAEETVLAEYGKMVEAAAALVATLPPQMRSTVEPWQDILGPEALRIMTLMEGDRLNRQGGPLLFDRLPSTGAVERREDGGLPTLAERIAELTAQLRINFDRAAPTQPQTPPPAAAMPVMSDPASVVSSSTAEVGYRAPEATPTNASEKVIANV